MLASLKFSIWLQILLLCPVLAIAKKTTSDRAELLRLESVWNEAHVRGDAGVLDRLWADDPEYGVTGQ